MLNAKRPGLRIWQFLVWDVAARRSAGGGYVCDRRHRRGKWQAAPRQEAYVIDRGIVPVTGWRSTQDARDGIAGLLHLRGRGEQAEVVVQHIGGHREATANRSPATLAGRPGKPDAWQEVLGLRFGRPERDQAGNVRDRVHWLPDTLRERHLRELVSQSGVDRKVLPDVPIIVGVPINHILVAVIGQVPDRPFRQIIGDLVREVSIETRVLVIATDALGKSLRRDVFPVLATEFEVVLSLNPADVVHDLIEILVSELGRVRIRSQLDAVSFAKADDQIREGIEARERKVARRIVVEVPVKSETDFIVQISRKIVIFAQSKDMETLRNQSPECRYLALVVGSVVLLIGVAAAYLILFGDVPIQRGDAGQKIGKVGPGKTDIPYRHGCVASNCR